MWDLVLTLVKPEPPALEGEILATGQPGEVPDLLLIESYNICPCLAYFIKQTVFWSLSVAAHTKLSLSVIGDVPLCGQTTFPLAAHLLMDTCVGSTFWQIMSSAALNTYVQISIRSLL